MKVLDLYCGAGGAALGYARAGFKVTGVDIAEQPSFLYEFVQRDVLNLDLEYLRGFDLIHASPPCQAHTALKHAPNAKVHLDLIPATRLMLRRSGVPYVIENVVGAPLQDAVVLCGSMFRLGAWDRGIWFKLLRHRLFEASWPIDVPHTCDHNGPVVGVYGGHARTRSAVYGGRDTKEPWERPQLDIARDAMGIPHLNLKELSQAIPPAYTQHIATSFMIWHARAAA